MRGYDHGMAADRDDATRNGGELANNRIVQFDGRGDSDRQRRNRPPIEQFGKS